MKTHRSTATDSTTSTATSIRSAATGPTAIETSPIDTSAVDISVVDVSAASEMVLVKNRLPMLVTGVAGVAGYAAFKRFHEQYPGQVFGLRPVVTWKLTGPGIIECDLEDHARLRQVFDKYQFRTVLHCGGSCALKSCELDPAMARRVNVVAVDSMLSAIEHADDPGNRTRLVFLSIDLVYSGLKGGGYLETEPPDPVTVYGKTMAEAERMVMKRRPDASVLRISLPMGVSFNGHAGAIDWIGSRFVRGLPATLYYDEVRTPTYVDCLNEVCRRFINSDFRGLFHAGGINKLSLFEIAQIVNLVGGFDPDLLHGCFRIQAGPMPPRAGNVTLCSDKLTEILGYVPFADWPRDRLLIPAGRDWHRSPHLRGRLRQFADEQLAAAVSSDKMPPAIERLLYRRNFVSADLAAD